MSGFRSDTLPFILPGTMMECGKPFPLFVTNIDGSTPFLRISGHLNKGGALMVDSIIDKLICDFDNGTGAVGPADITEGMLCVVKYKDGSYYRAKILSSDGFGTVVAHFIDFGNKDSVSAGGVRAIEGSRSPMIQSLAGMAPQASEFVLARIMQQQGTYWEPSFVAALHNKIGNREYLFRIEKHLATGEFAVGFVYDSRDFVEYVGAVSSSAIMITVEQQEMMLEAAKRRTALAFPYPPPKPAPYASPFSRGAPLLAALTPERAPPPFSPLQRSARAGRAAYELAAPRPLRAREPAKMSPQKERAPCTYRPSKLEIDSSHEVYVSFVEDGPWTFAVQLDATKQELKKMMDSINVRPHRSLSEPPTIGSVCLGRFSEGKVMCRAVVMGTCGQKCSLFFVDFGVTETVSYYDIFDIPEEFVAPSVFALRFGLSGSRELERSAGVSEAFRNLVHGQILDLKVVSPEGPPLIQYCELRLDGRNLKDVLKEACRPALYKFDTISDLPVDADYSVLVSFVDSVTNFFIQLSDNIDSLTETMGEVETHCKRSEKLDVSRAKEGMACCALFPDDKTWYRAEIVALNGDNTVKVRYVDYGNEEDVPADLLRPMVEKLVKLKAQAIRCTLKGYEGKQVKQTVTNQMEMLALEKCLNAHLFRVLEDGALLVDLIDENEHPPLNIARRMAELTQPRHPRGSADSTDKPFKAPKTISSAEDTFEGIPSPTISPPKHDRQERPKYDRDRQDRPERQDRQDRQDRTGHDRQDRSRDVANTFRSNEDFKSKPRRDNPGRYDRRRDDGNNEKTASNDTWDDGEDTRKTNHPRQNKDRLERGYRRDRQVDRPSVNERLQRPRTARSDWESTSSHSDKSGETAKPYRSKDNWQDRSKNRDRGEGAGPKDSWGGEKSNKREGWADKSNKKDDWEGDQSSSKPAWGDKPSYRPRTENQSSSKETWGDKPSYKPRSDDQSSSWGEKPGYKPRSDGYQNRRDDNRGGGDKRDFKRDNRSLGSGSDSGYDGPRKPRSFAPEPKNLSNPVSLDTAFSSLEIEMQSQHEVTVAWFISPEIFYVQLSAQQPQLNTMMNTIAEMYKGVKPFTGTIDVNSTVMARFPEDKVLYRATVVEVKSFSTYLVQYVDFGNKCVVESKDIWQADSDVLTLPKVAIPCILEGVAAVGESWQSSTDLDSCFNSPRYQCIFHSLGEDGKYTVSLWNNSVSVSQMLIERNLAIAAATSSGAVLKDEPMSLDFIIGQQLLCRVSHVVSMERFYLQLDPIKATAVETANKDYKIENLQNLAEESIIDGCHCIVKTDENKIHRAILTDTSDKSNIKATLPDSGREITTSQENVMVLPDVLTAYYYQSSLCQLHNFVSGTSETLMTDDEFKEKTMDKMFIAFVDNLVGESYEVTLYNRDDGKKLECFTPDEGAHASVPVPTLHPVYNQNFGVSFVSHVETLNKVYLQKVSNSDSIGVFLDQLFEYYDNENKGEDIPESEDDPPCAAKAADGNWYRAIVLERNEPNCTVQFIDYGNSETVPSTNVKKLDPKFNEPYALALEVSLGLTALNEDAVGKLVEYTDGKEIEVTLTLADTWYASLFVGGVDIGAKLVEEGLAALEEESHPTETITEEGQKESNRTPGSTLVYVTHIDSPGQFWLQLASDVDDIENIQAKLQEVGEGLPDLDSKDVGIICTAKFSVDEQWYRAEILDSDNDIVTVRFVDYGNTDVLNNAPGLIKQLPENFGGKEKYALKCSVNATPTGTRQWTEPASDLFKSSIGDLEEPVDALIVLKDVTTYVDLYVSGKNVTDILITNGFASKSDIEESGGSATCFASHINSPSEFWVQLESSIPDLQLIENEMSVAHTFAPLSEIEEGVICAAKYPEDDMWYRAQIIINGSNGTEVLFMDYGNASLTTELRTLPEELKAKPALSRKCALQKPGNIKSWSQQSEMKFSELAAEGATIFNVQFIASGDISIVELFLEEQSVTDELISLSDSNLSTTERPSPIGQDNLPTGFVSVCESPNDFYLKFEGNSDLEKITETLLDAETGQEVTDIQMGELYAARWSDDKEWYRGRVVGKSDDATETLFIDFGNKAMCEEFRVLAESIQNIKPQVQHCTMAMDLDNEDIIARFEELTNGGNTAFEIEILDSNSTPALVKLFLKGENVCSKLIASLKSEEDETNKMNANPNDLIGTDSTPLEDEAEKSEVTMQKDEAHETEVKNGDEQSDVDVTEVKGSEKDEETALDHSPPLEDEAEKSEVTMQKDEAHETEVKNGDEQSDVDVTEVKGSEKDEETALDHSQDVVVDVKESKVMDGIENKEINTVEINESNEIIAEEEKHSKVDDIEDEELNEDVIVAEEEKNSVLDESKKVDDTIVQEEESQEKNEGADITVKTEVTPITEELNVEVNNEITDEEKMPSVELKSIKEKTICEPASKDSQKQSSESNEAAQEKSSNEDSPTV